MPTRKGTVLIIVLGVLVLLALLAASFATLQSIERRVTHNYTDEVRAKLVAQSGIETAVDRLNQLIYQGWFKDGFKADMFFRYNPSLQVFFDNASKVSTKFVAPVA